MRLVFAGGQFNGNVLTISLLAFAGYEAIYGIVQLIYGTSRHELYPVTGSFNNPGPYSACIAIGLVIVFTYIRYPRFLEFLNNHQRFRLIVSTVNQMLAVIFAALIIITLSRTAIVAIALCLSILFWDRMGRWKWLALVGCLALGISLYIVKSGSADGRMTIYFVGAYAIIDNPLLGNGVGSFFHRIAETTQMLSLSETNMDLKPIDVIEYAFNDWLRITVELGFICLVLVSVIVVYTLLNLWKNSQSLFLSMLVIIVFSFFSYPMELLPYRIITIIIISFSASHTKFISRHAKENGKVVKNPIITSLIIVCCSMFLINPIKTFVKAEKDYDMIRGIDDPDLIRYYASLLTMLSENRAFLFDYGRMLAKAGRYNDSNDILRRGSMISNEPMFLILLGNNYRDMGAFNEAEKMYVKARHTIPNRIYPLYRLMLLYVQTCNYDKAMEYAKVIVGFKEKKYSPAVRDIKREAQEIINRKKMGCGSSNHLNN